ncbi:MAG: carboxypeptidase regulatory-like domain-containing protein [Candidatus Alcyoniella australis]|nr:carboxypeptidase regulatory-like domain-containing protein [Candidatus Alcyoniella australis]
MTAIWLVNPPMVRAYGSATHVAEAMAYLESIRTQPLAGPRGDYELLSEPDNLMYLKLGSIWPDLMRIWPGVDFEPHNHDLGLWLLETAAEQPEPWKLALAVGNLNHQCGDVVAQNMGTQYYGVKGRWGDLDVIRGVQDDRPGGEKEAALEMTLELMRIDLQPYIELAQYFLTDLTQPDPLLFTAADWYLEQVEIYHNLDYGSLDREQAFQALVAKLQPVSDPERWGAALNPDAPIEQRLADAWPLIGPKGDIEIDQLMIYWDELLRVLGGPLSQPDFYDDYFTLFKPLSVVILREMGDPGDLWQDWPNWEQKTNIGGSVASLMAFLPEIYADQHEVFVTDCRWLDWDQADYITEFDHDSPPSEVRAEVRIFVAAPVDELFVLRVLKDVPGFSYQSDTLVEQKVFRLTIDPADYGSVPQEWVMFDFSPGDELLDARGITLELARHSDGKALFTTSFDQMLAITQTDVFTPNYHNKWDSYGKQWPYGLRVLNPQFSADSGDISGRVVDLVSGKGIEGATVELEGLGNATTNQRGRYTFDGVDAGEHTLSAAPEGYAPGSIEVDLESGGWIRRDIEVSFIPLVDDGGPYSTDNQTFPIIWDCPEGRDLEGFEAALGSQPGLDDLVSWQDAGSGRFIELYADGAVEDGTLCYGAVRPKLADQILAAGFGDGVLVDRSPPELEQLTEISDPEDGWQRDALVTWGADDPHSGLAAQALCLGSSSSSCDLLDWTALDSSNFELDPAQYASEPPIYLRVVLFNNAGLSSEGTLEIVGPTAEDDAEDSADDTSPINGRCCGR